MARVLIFMAHSQEQALGGRGDRAPGRVFECKTCSRVFTSFQALGGHRSSHKKPRLDADGGPPAKPRLHGCPICGVEFAIGQALGGHMRRHRAVAHGLVKKKAGDADGGGNRRPWLDLNRLPCDDMDGERFRNAGELTPRQFSGSGPLAMDCVGY